MVWGSRSSQVHPAAPTLPTGRVTGLQQALPTALGQAGAGGKGEEGKSGGEMV